MAELSVKMTSDEAELFVKMQQLISKTKETEKVLVEASAASTEASKAAALAAREQQSLGNQGKRIAESLVKSSETLEESYNRQAALIIKAGEQGKLSADEQAKAMALLRQKTDEQALAQEQAARAQEQAAIEASTAYKQQQKEVREGVAEVNRLIKSAQSLEDQYAELKTKIKAAFDQGQISASEYRTAISQLDKEFKETNKSQFEVIGKNALGSVTSLVTSYLSLSTAISTARQALTEFNDEQQKGRDETKRLEDARRNLLQISTGDFDQLEQRADAAAVRFGVDRITARETLFSARSEGFEKDYESILAMDPLIPAAASSRVAGQTAGIFGNQYNSMQMIAGVYKGAVDSRLNFQQVAQLVPEAAEGGALTGASAQETIAAVSVLATQLNNPAARLKALATKMALDDRTKGLGFIGGVEALMGMSEEDLKGFLGDSQEANTAFDVFSKNIAKIKGRSADIEQEMAVAGTEKSLINQRLVEFGGQGILFENQTSKRMEIQRQIASEEELASTAHRNQAYRDYANARMTRDGTSSLGRFVVNRGYDMAGMFGQDIQDTVARGADITKEFKAFQAEQRETNKYLKQIAENPSKVLSRPGEDK